MKIVHILIILLGSSFLLSVPIDRYHTYDEIQAKLEAWDQEYGIESGSSDIIFELSEIGRSALLDLPFWMVKISDNANEDEDEPRLLIQENHFYLIAFQNFHLNLHKTFE